MFEGRGSYKTFSRGTKVEPIGTKVFGLVDGTPQGEPLAEGKHYIVAQKSWPGCLSGANFLFLRERPNLEFPAECLRAVLKQ